MGRHSTVRERVLHAFHLAHMGRARVPYYREVLEFVSAENFTDNQFQFMSDSLTEPAESPGWKVDTV